MKKTILSCCLLMCLYIVSNAKSVSVSDAKTIGSNYLLQHGKSMLAKPDALNLVYSSGTNPTNFYVFGGERCFVIVAADDAVTPILGYGTDQPFAPDNLPPQLTDLVQEYSKQINHVIAQKYEASPTIAKQWEYLKQNKTIEGAQRTTKTTSVSPLIATTWNQNPGYNDLCPYDAACYSYTDYRCYTGCAATAMAQVMYYWQWPTYGIGTNTYTTTTSGYGPLTVDFSTATYDWAGMPIAANSPAVETLMYHAGVAINMDYGCNGSDAYTVGTPSVYSGLKDHFCYNPATLQGIVRTSYTDVAWLATIENELDNQRPVIYRGTGSSGGHIWVVDGYDASDYFHCNWGWGSMDNGYYYMNSLVPGPISNGAYSTGHYAVIGIIPNAPNVYITGTDSVAMGYTVSLSASLTDGTWYSNNTTIATVNTSGVVTGIASGYDTINYLVSNSCGSRTAIYVIHVTDSSHTAVSNVNAIDNRISIFPNPNKGIFTVNLATTGEATDISVYNIVGKIVYTNNVINANKTVVDISNLPAGAYLVKVATGDNIYRKEIVVE